MRVVLDIRLVVHFPALDDLSVGPTLAFSRAAARQRLSSQFVIEPPTEAFDGEVCSAHRFFEPLR